MSQLLYLARIACGTQQAEHSITSFNSSLVKGNDIYERNLQFAREIIQQVARELDINNIVEEYYDERDQDKPNTSRMGEQEPTTKMKSKKETTPTQKGVIVHDKDSSINSTSEEEYNERDKKGVKKKRGRYIGKETYRCSCSEKYSKVWRVKQDIYVKICEDCKKGQLVVRCTLEKPCNTCRRGLNPRPCEISLKFRKHSLEKFKFIVEKMKFLNVHVFQNVFEKFNVMAFKQAKKRRLSADNSASISKIDKSKKKAKGTIQTLIDSNQDLLPFTWNELSNMKFLSPAEKELLKKEENEKASIDHKSIEEEEDEEEDDEETFG